MRPTVLFIDLASFPDSLYVKMGVPILIGYLEKYVPEYNYDHLDLNSRVYVYKKENDIRFLSTDDLFLLYKILINKKIKKIKNLFCVALSNIHDKQQLKLAIYLSETLKQKYPKVKTVVQLHNVFQSNKTYRYFDKVFDFEAGEIVFAKYLEPSKQYPYTFERISFKDIEHFKKYNTPLPIYSRRLFCINNCAFCLFNNYKLPFYKSLNIDNIKQLDRFENFADDLEYIVNSTGIKEFMFLDNAINFNLEESKEFLRKIINKNINISYVAHILINKIDNEFINLLKKSGCHTINVGLESGSFKMLKYINKAYVKTMNLFKMVRTVLRFKKIGFNVIINIIYAFPYETNKSLNKTIKLIKMLDKYNINLSINRFYLPENSYFSVKNKHYHIVPRGDYCWDEIWSKKDKVMERGDRYTDLLSKELITLKHNSGEEIVNSYAFNRSNKYALDQGQFYNELGEKHE